MHAETELAVLASICNTQYVHLHTLGDGACGLSAVFGQPRGGELSCGAGVREVVAAHMQRYVDGIEHGARQGIRRFRSAELSLWEELWDPCAEESSEINDVLPKR